MSWPVLVFDIESIPDVAGLRALGDYPAEFTDEQVYTAWVEARKAEGKSDFAPLYLQRILVLSVVFRSAEGLKVHSFVDRDGQSEGKIVQDFFRSIEKHEPQLVSWNGGGFDLPVLHYRGLRHGVEASKYWDMGDDNPEATLVARQHHERIRRAVSVRWLTGKRMLCSELPETDPRYLNFVDLRAWVLALPGFDDAPGHSGEKVLEAIQMAWIEERE
jgi:FeS assembly protein IscX